jgi:mannose-6-phosphate isomerase-like protein (cupin superfamily)
MKRFLNNKDSNVIKENDTYTLIDNTELKGLVVSKTILHPGKNTNGHFHKGQEEVYQFVSGHGTMTVGDNSYLVGAGDVVLIPDGDFHKVWNNSETEDLVFVCVFDGARRHKY